MDEIIENVVNCIKKVKDELGDFYKENIYQNALRIELERLKYYCGTEVIIPIHYNGIYIGFERADIVIYDSASPHDIKLIIELKSQNTKLANKETVQLKKYIKNVNCERGILVNFYEKLEIIKVDHEISQKINYC
jgi:GxxExxY protein|tara:strand:+ start:5893 stop:6297 length:405 start_codon:yes stop_codon:yes gene_type:complete